MHEAAGMKIEPFHERQGYVHAPWQKIEPILHDSPEQFASLVLPDFLPKNF